MLEGVSEVENSPMSRAELTLRMAAPYLAVIVFWLIFHNAWMAILGYHAQILFWSRGSLPDLGKPKRTPIALLVLPSVLAGPVVFFLLPYVTHTDLAGWLTDNQLSGAAFLLMVFYFGLIHPILEQAHWAPLRESTPIAHFAFAGYHMLVLYSLLALPWLALCFIVLVAVSWLWQKLAEESGTLLLPIASHIAGDLSIVIAAWLSIGP